MHVEPYLHFDGRCEEAIEFYKSALGAEIQMLMRYKDMPEPRQPGSVPPGSENKVMHASVRIGESTVNMSDGQCKGTTEFRGFSLSALAKTDAEADRVFNALSNGGNVSMPLTKTFFTSRFGMVKDRFGIQWMVLVRP